MNHAHSESLNAIMECLIYYSVSDISVCEGIFNTVKGVSGGIYCRNHIIKIGNYRLPKCNLEDIYKCLCFFLSNISLKKEDEIYIYYWALNVTGVWQLKKKDSLKVSLTHKILDHLDISLGAKLGIID